MCLLLVNDQHNTWMGQTSGLRKHFFAVPAQGPAHPQQLQNWPDNLQHASIHYQLPPAACRKAQLQLPSFTFLMFMVQCSLHQLPAGRPNCTNFPFPWCSWCFRVADYSWPVAMADCCSCPSPCCLLKPLIECMVDTARSTLLVM